MYSIPAFDTYILESVGMYTGILLRSGECCRYIVANSRCGKSREWITRLGKIVYTLKIRTDASFIFGMSGEIPVFCVVCH